MTLQEIVTRRSKTWGLVVQARLASIFPSLLFAYLVLFADIGMWERVACCFATGSLAILIIKILHKPLDLMPSYPTNLYIVDFASGNEVDRYLVGTNECIDTSKSVQLKRQINRDIIHFLTFTLSTTPEFTIYGTHVITLMMIGMPDFETQAKAITSLRDEKYGDPKAVLESIAAKMVDSHKKGEFDKKAREEYNKELSRFGYKLLRYSFPDEH